MAKTIFLIRHGQSEENVKIAEALEGWNRMKRLSFPRRKNLRAAFSLASLETDSPLSLEGQQQVETVADTLRSDDFLSKYQPQLHLHSPLQRARETHNGLFPECSKIQLECLRELTAAEYLFSPNRTALKRRIAEFETWVSERNETRLVVVGHSKFFELMLGADSVMGNCSVLHCTYHPQLSGSERWVVHETLYSVTK